MNQSWGDVHGTSVQIGRADVVNLGGTVPTALDGLPPATATFTGRASELAALAAASGLVVISGMPGVGKTELVLHFAAGADFPGGRLFWNFHGYDEALRTTPDQALEAFLRALGVVNVPPTEHDRGTLYRSLVAERESMIIVLDNANLAAQVRPFLVPHHLVVVTSRTRLNTLEGATVLPLGMLSEDEATELVGRQEIARLCGNLPIALQIMAALQRSDPDHDWLGELRKSHDRLTFLDDGERTVRASFDLSYRSLSPRQQRFFRLLPLHPGNEVSLEGAAALADCSPAEADKLLRELRSANLLESGSRFHDLLRIYATVLADDETPRALDRLLAHFVAECEEARRQVRLGRAAAGEWFGRFRRPLIQLVATAYDAGKHHECVRLALCLAELLAQEQWDDDWLEIVCTAVDSAAATQDPFLRSRTLASLGHALLQGDQPDLALVAFAEAVHVAHEHRYPYLTTYAALGMVSTLAMLDRKTEAIALADELRSAIQDNSAALHSLGLALAVEGQPLFAVDCYTDALAGTSDEANLRVCLGQALVDCGRHRDALVEFTAAISAAPDDHALVCHAYLSLGHTHEVLHEPAQAEQAWTHAAQAAALAQHEPLIRRAQARLAELPLRTLRDGRR